MSAPGMEDDEHSKVQGLGKVLMIIETVGENMVRVHAPRHGFQVAAYQPI